ncbi:MAG: hypothetical protein WD273_05650 [Trueperaceae bacterium]
MRVAVVCGNCSAADERHAISFLKGNNHAVIILQVDQLTDEDREINLSSEENIEAPEFCASL